jgi:murein DD-endopeptidase / murein LD-carboxypeptidase
MKLNHAESARALIGTRFRPQGRAPAMGVDCVGLIICAFRLPESLVRRDYRMRGDHHRELLRELGKEFRRIPGTRRRAGDVLLMRVAHDQLHLGIMTDSGFVHADARLGKVVESAGSPPWQIVGAFRRRVRKQRYG